MSYIIFTAMKPMNLVEDVHPNVQKAPPQFQELDRKEVLMER